LKLKPFPAKRFRVTRCDFPPLYAERLWDPKRRKIFIVICLSVAAGPAENKGGQLVVLIKFRGPTPRGPERAFCGGGRGPVIARIRELAWPAPLGGGRLGYKPGFFL